MRRAGSLRSSPFRTPFGSPVLPLHRATAADCRVLCGPTKEVSGRLHPARHTLMAAPQPRARAVVAARSFAYARPQALFPSHTTPASSTSRAWLLASRPRAPATPLTSRNNFSASLSSTWARRYQVWSQDKVRPPSAGSLAVLRRGSHSMSTVGWTWSLCCWASTPLYLAGG